MKWKNKSFSRFVQQQLIFFLVSIMIISSATVKAGTVSSGDASAEDVEQVGTVSSGNALPEESDEESVSSGDFIDKKEIVLTAYCDGITVELSGVSSSFPKGELELCISKLEGAKSSTEGSQVNVDQALETLDLIVAEQEGDVLEQILFDITLMCDGEEVQPEQSVEVKFYGLLQAEEVQAQIYHIEDNGIETEMVTSEIQEDGSLCMEVEHFSIYGIVVTTRVSTDGTLGHFSGSEEPIPEPMVVDGGSNTPYNRLNIHYMANADAEVLAYSKLRTNSGAVCLAENVPNNLKNDPNGGNPFHGHWSDVYVDDSNTAVDQNVYHAFGSDCPGAIAFQFAGSNRYATNYATNPDAGWDTSDLELETTQMWIQIRYKNVGTFNGKAVGADMMLRITPYKNRTRYDGGYSWAENGVGHNYEGTYYPTIQISKCLAQGWVWQNVREFDVELQFYYMDNTDTGGVPRSYLQLRGAGEKGYDSLVAEYYTIHSLNPTFIRAWEYPAHNHGPEYVLPRTSEKNAWNAYVYNGRRNYGHSADWNSHISSSYQDPGYNADGVPAVLKRTVRNGGKGWPTSSKQYPLTYAYSGGTEAWNGDSAGRDNWLQNSILIMPKDTTDTWAFTLGNLMRYPDGKVSVVENDKGTETSKSPGSATQGTPQMTRYPQGTHSDAGWDYDFSQMAVNNTIGVPRTDVMWAAMASDPFNKSQHEMSILQVMKVSEEESNKPLAGAVFELTDSENMVIDVLETDEQGIAYFYLPHDMELLLQETKSPEGYQMMEINSWKVYATDEKVTITEILSDGTYGAEYIYDDAVLDDDGIHNIYQFNIKNKKKAGIAITKVDGVTGETLEGAEFYLARTGIKNWSVDDKDGALSVELTADSYNQEEQELKERNMALNVRAFASSELTSSSGPRAATDGNSGTAWESALPGAMIEGAVNPEEQWLVIDLGGVKNIDSIKIYWGQNYASSFRVQIADVWTDDTIWQDVAFEREQGAVYVGNQYSHMASTGGVQEIVFSSDVGARFIKIYCLTAASPNGTYEIAEAEIWGNSGSAVLLRHEDNGNNTWGGIYQSVYLTTNNEYTLSFYAKASGTFYFKIMNSDWSLVDGGTEWYYYAAEVDGYRQYSVTFTIPQQSEAKKEVIILLGDASGELVYYDDVQVCLGEYTSNLLSNGSFEENENYVATTDEYGKCFFENLSVGTYWLRETIVPSGYLLPEQGWMVEVSASDSDPLDMVVVINGENVERINTNQPEDNVWSFRIANQRGILLRKLGVSENGGVQPALSGVSFDVYRVAEDAIIINNLIQNGDFSNGESYWYGDAKGDETSTAQISFSDNTAQIVTTNASQKWSGIIQEIVVEQNTNYSLRWKVKGSGQLLVKIVPDWSSSAISESYLDVFDEENFREGTVNFSSGSYEKIILQFAQNADSGNITLDDLVLCEVTDASIASQIPGAPEGVVGTRYNTILTGGNGEASLIVPDGEYYLVETRTNTGYQLLDSSIYMKIEGGLVTELLDNYYGEIAVLKTDEATGIPLLQITNYKIFEMPETGAHNWTYPVGSRILVLAVLALLGKCYFVYRRQKREQET